jgi:hypothetical protein
VKQIWPRSPQGAQVLFEQVVPPMHTEPAQQGWLVPPQGWHMPPVQLVPGMQKLVPAQQGSLAEPHNLQLPLRQEVPAAVQAAPGQQG